MMNKKDKNYLWQVVTLILVLSIVTSWLMTYSYYNYKELNKGKFRISELEEGVGIQICPYSIDTTNLICKNDKITYGTLGLTQDKLTQILENCQNPVLITSKECLSEQRLTIIGKKEK